MDNFKICSHKWSEPELVEGLWGYYNGWAHRCSKCEKWEERFPPKKMIDRRKKMWDNFITFIYGNKYWSKITAALMPWLDGLAMFGITPNFFLTTHQVIQERKIKSIHYNIDIENNKTYRAIKGYTELSNNVMVFMIIFDHWFADKVVFIKALNKKTDADGQKENIITSEVIAKLDEICIRSI